MTTISPFKCNTYLRKKNSREEGVCKFLDDKMLKIKNNEKEADCQVYKENVPLEK